MDTHGNMEQIVQKGGHIVNTKRESEREREKERGRKRQTKCHQVIFFQQFIEDSCRVY